MLVPVLMEKIPSELKLMIPRKCSSEKLWNIKNLSCLQRRVGGAGSFYKNN